jgi:hypothetical protein
VRQTLKSASGSRPQVVRRRAQRRDDVDVDADRRQQPPDLAHVVAAAEAERRGAEQVRARRPVGGARRARRPGRGRQRRAQGAHELVEGLAGAPVLLLGVRGQLERDHRDRQPHALGERPRLVLDQLRGAALADQQRGRAEALVGVAHRLAHQVRRVAAEVARLEGRVRDRRAAVVPLDHREQQVGVRVALRRVEHVVDVAHRRRHAHRADVRRPSYVQSVSCIAASSVRPSGARAAPAGGRTARPGRPPGRSPGWA